MALKNKWGPPIWVFFHTLIESIKEESYTSINKEIFVYIKSFCNYLPCPICSKHAKEYLRRIHDNHIKTKNDFRMILYVFHNKVNERLNHEKFNLEQFEIYKNISLSYTLSNFVKIFSKTGNLQQINESFHRKMLVSNFINFMNKHQNCFNCR